MTWLAFYNFIHKFSAVSFNEPIGISMNQFPLSKTIVSIDKCTEQINTFEQFKKIRLRHAVFRQGVREGENKIERRFKNTWIWTIGLGEHTKNDCCHSICWQTCFIGETVCQLFAFTDATCSLYIVMYEMMMEWCDMMRCTCTRAP